MIKRIFIGQDGKLRAGLRAVIFFAATFALLFAVQFYILGPVADRLGVTAGLTAGGIALNEAAIFVAAFLVTAAFALYERRGIGSYGLPPTRALSGDTLAGFVAGIVMAGAVAAGMIALGGVQVSGLALTGRALAMAGLAWLGANVCVGIAEELWFRAYFLQTFWRSIGFWPGAVAVALVFAALHYFFKDGENVWDVITLVSLSLLMSWSVLRSGMLWFAVGVHIAFDFMQFFVIGTPNGDQVPQGHMLNASFHGPAWVNGGVLGTEASFLMYPAIAALWLYVWWRYRGRAALSLNETR